MANCAIGLCLAAALVVALSGLALPVRAAEADSCLDNRAAQALVASHRIKTWPAIKAMAGISDQYKEVSAVRVCELDGVPYYVVNVAGPTGESRQLVLNAVTGTN